MQKYETFTSDEICIADLVLYKNYMLRNTDAMNEFSFIVGQFQDIERQLKEQYKLMFTVALSLKHHLVDHIHLIEKHQINNPVYQEQQLFFILKK
ncbi:MULTISPECIES: hypothetical protein [Gilliamella]|nr:MULTISPECIES: hypothetical protein [Gilliamella]MWP62996.1 hypothetical protein [Gilliamella sp. Pas-s25]